MARDPSPPPAPSRSLADQFCKIMDDASRGARSAKRMLRSATKTVGAATLLGASAYALGKALVDFCPWCKKSLRKAAHTPICPTCHNDTLVWSKERQEEWEERRKAIRAASKRERERKEDELLHELMEEEKREKKEDEEEVNPRSKTRVKKHKN